MPGDTDVKTCELVCDMLKLKHSEGGGVAVENLPLFDSCYELIQIQGIDENVELVTNTLSGLLGPSGIDSIFVSHWLLKFGGASANLRKSIAKLVE